MGMCCLWMLTCGCVCAFVESARRNVETMMDEAKRRQKEQKREEGKKTVRCHFDTPISAGTSEKVPDTERAAVRTCRLTVDAVQWRTIWRAAVCTRVSTFGSGRRDSAHIECDY